MTSIPTALALALVSASPLFASAAHAQYYPSTPAPAVPAAPAAPATASRDAAATAPGRKFDISNAARKEIAALQAAVTAKSVATIPGLVTAAQAKAKTADDKYVIAQLQLRAAVDANDTAAMAPAIEAIIASGAVTAAETNPLYISLGKLDYNAKAYDRASKSFERLLQIDANNTDAMVMLAETRNAQSRTADGVALMQKAIAIRAAGGKKADEAWYKRAVALSYNAKLASAPALARDWAAAYPTPKNWRDAIRIYQSTSKLDDGSLIDSMRLASVAGALAGENDYYRFANVLVTRGFPGEAKLVLDQGFASRSIDKARPMFSQLYATATAKSQGDRATLATSGKAALAASAAKDAMSIADAYYGYGDYAQAIELYRAALTKTGADKDLVNLRIGMALTRSGDKAGATAAFGAAGGAQAEVAKLWLAYLATKA